MSTSNRGVFSTVFTFAFLLSSHVTKATEYFVNKRGNDANLGSSLSAAFATIQKGVSALRPGDTLSVGPGEYSEAVKCTDLGDLDQDTIIRAEIPGTVTLRGDVPAPKFRPLEGYRFVYVADFPFAGQMPAVNEIDTLTILKRMPNFSELEFIPGTFYHDAQAGKLYLSTSDMQGVDVHRYSISIIPTHGVHLIRPKRVVFEGFNMTGFSAMELVHYREETAGGIWGLFVANGKKCVVRDCRAYLNAWGIGFNSIAEGSGDNVIERCVAWGNKSTFANGDMGGITIFNARRDTIRQSLAYRNGVYGINIYGTGGAPPHSNGDGNDEKNKSHLEDNVAWGNETADFKIKTGYDYFHVAKNCVSPGKWSVANVTRGTIGVSVASKGPSAENDILFSNHTDLDLQKEFADPLHHDYRLQATSRFRGAGINGEDQGAFPYQPHIFYVSPTGDDDADGLSVSKAWKSFDRAVRNLRAGDTVYLEPGDYAANVEPNFIGTAVKPITIRGRGTGVAQLNGNLKLNDCQHVHFERLTIQGEVQINRGNEFLFANTTFVANKSAIAATGLRGLRISHCIFAAFTSSALDASNCTDIDLRGNLFHNVQGPAVKLNDFQGLRYSNYNSYYQTSAAWQVDGQWYALAEVPRGNDQQSAEIQGQFVDHRLTNPHRFTAQGPLGKPIGCYRDEPRRMNLQLVASPKLHSVSATTANVEWATSLPATCLIAWGETPACVQSRPFNVNCFGTFSLTGLEPGKTYYFRIRSIETPRDILPKTEHQAVQLNNEPLSFTTLVRNAAPSTFYVSNTGNDNHTGLTRDQAWRTLRHAAAKVNVGDTVLIAGGKYFERIRLRATGELNHPISFRCIPGERVEINGDNMLLNSGFVAGGKSHLRFDGLYFANFNLFPNDSWSLSNNGEFQLYAGKDIQITRCFSEGRGGYSAYPVSAYHIEDLVIRNCVNTYKFGGMYFWRCPNLLIENTVFAEPMIMAFVLRNEKDQLSTMRNCIFTDMLEKKAKINLGILCCDGAIDGFRQENNCYFLRDCIPLEDRSLNGNMKLSQMGKYMHEPLFADPLFAGDPGVRNNPQDKSGFSPDRMMDSILKIDFHSFYSGQSELIKRGIGLQPDAFKDFHFHETPASASSKTSATNRN